MILIVGLGNPGKKFQKTWHNLGFQTIDAFFKKNKKAFSFSNFQLRKKTNSLISEGKFNNKRIILAKPQTFINESGKAVKRIFNFQFSIFKQSSINQFSNKNLIVIHDDLDIPLGRIRISRARGSAGHKGVQSIIEELKTKNFIRFRLGIRPEQYHRLVCDTKRFVLKKFNKREEKIVKKAIKKTIKAIEFSLKEGIEKAMQKYNV